MHVLIEYGSTVNLTVYYLHEFIYVKQNGRHKERKTDNKALFYTQKVHKGETCNFLMV